MAGAVEVFEWGGWVKACIRSLLSTAKHNDTAGMHAWHHTFVFCPCLMHINAPAPSPFSPAARTASCAACWL